MNDITPEFKQLEKEIKGFERNHQRLASNAKKLARMISKDENPHPYDLTVLAHLRMNEAQSALLINELKRRVARAKYMSAEDLRRIGQAHLRSIKMRYR